jgi:hypothetical protein
MIVARKSADPEKSPSLCAYLAAVPTIEWVLLVTALVVTLTVAGSWQLSRSSTCGLMLNLWGTVLLAFALEVQEPKVPSQSRLQWVLERGWAGFVGFNKVEFYLGLTCLAGAAILSAIS